MLCVAMCFVLVHFDPGLWAVGPWRHAKVSVFWGL